MANFNKTICKRRRVTVASRRASRRDPTILGGISKRGNRYLRNLFVQAAWVVLVKIGPKHWDRYGLKSWIEAARKRLRHNVLAIARANSSPASPGRFFTRVRLRARQDQ